uniref:Alpha-1,3-mannosyl-glycoprotein 2-beta-N-acetylglucosaminyltransferase n=1 Tax=Triticum urartu TaxID=4572 RepID=A0A8R7QJ29_TRIUA
MKVRQYEEHVQLKILVQDLEKRSLQTLINKNVVPVAAVVIMACNRPDYLQRTVESILNYALFSPSLHFPKEDKFRRLLFLLMAPRAHSVDDTCHLYVKKN